MTTRNDAFEIQSLCFHRTMFQHLHQGTKFSRHKENDQAALKLYVGFALFGAKQEKMDWDGSVLANAIYKDEECEIIESLYNKIKAHSSDAEENIHLATIFVTAEVPHENRSGEDTYQEIPVFRVRKQHEVKEEEKVCFIDIFGRIYSSWSDFLENNMLPQGVRISYPDNGYYELDPTEETNTFPHAKIVFGMSPSTSLAVRIGDVSGGTTGVISVGAYIGAMAMMLVSGGHTVAVVHQALIQVSNATGIVAGVWGAGRGGTSLFDRYTHDQTLALTEEGARSAWFTFIGLT